MRNRTGTLTRNICWMAIAFVVLAVRTPALAEPNDELDLLLGGEPAKPPSAQPEAPKPQPAEPENAAPQAETVEAPQPAAGTPEASQAARRRVIEEIIVTAQKTEQGIRDVPISMSVLNDEFMSQERITDFKDLSLYIPNTNINPHGIYPDLRIRGFGSDPVNKAFEQSVGVVLDGIPYGRQQYFQGALFDVDRVEVLRGPQGILFGKNTTAGLFSVVTKNPTNELTGFVDAELGELERRRVEAAIGGPLIANLLNVRLAGISDERDGHLENTTAQVVPGLDPRMNGRDRKALRFKLGFPDLVGANLVLGYERSAVELKGNGAEFREVPDKMKPFYRQFDANVDFDPTNWVGSLDHPGFSSMDGDTFAANGSVHLGGWELDAVAGYSFLKFAGGVDIDASPAPLTAVDPNSDKNHQTTFELRFASPRLSGLFGLERLFTLALGGTDFTGGLFYQQRDIDSMQRLQFNLPVAADAEAYQNLPPEGGEVPPPEAFIGPNVPIGNLGSFDTTQGNEVNTMFFDQSSSAVAGFGQMNWHFTDRWTLQYGMRLGYERKEANWKRVTEQGTGLLLRAFAGFEDFTANLSRSEFPSFTPKAALKYDWTDDINVYASWARGFKAGGFNEMAARNNPEEMTYDAETTTAWELGAKTQLLEGTARLNLALFRQNVTDMQVLSPDPNSIVVRTRNAGEARAQGVEIDGTWLPMNWLTVVGSLGFNDAKYLEFLLGPCARDRQGPNGVCDLSGKPLFRTPKWTSSVTPTVRLPLSSISAFGARAPWASTGIDWISSLTVEYQDSQYVSEEVDPRTRQPSFIRLNASVGLEDSSKGWSLGFTVQNLTDELVALRIADPPLGAGVFWQSPDTPRLFFGSLRWSF